MVESAFGELPSEVEVVLRVVLVLFVADGVVLLVVEARAEAEGILCTIRWMLMMTTTAVVIVTQMNSILTKTAIETFGT